MATPRHGTSATADQTYKATGMTLHYSEPAYAATLAITPNARESVYKVGALTGAITINATVTDCSAGDRIYFMFEASGGTRVVTLGSNIDASGTISIADTKTAGFSAIYNGSAFVPLGREIEG